MVLYVVAVRASCMQGIPNPGYGHIKMIQSDAPGTGASAASKPVFDAGSGHYYFNYGGAIPPATTKSHRQVWIEGPKSTKLKYDYLIGTRALCTQPYTCRREDKGGHRSSSAFSAVCGASHFQLRLHGLHQAISFVALEFGRPGQSRLSTRIGGAAAATATRNCQCARRMPA